MRLIALLATIAVAAAIASPDKAHARFEIQTVPVEATGLSAGGFSGAWNTGNKSWYPKVWSEEVNNSTRFHVHF